MQSDEFFKIQKFEVFKREYFIQNYLLDIQGYVEKLNFVQINLNEKNNDIIFQTKVNFSNFFFILN